MLNGLNRSHWSRSLENLGIADPQKLSRPVPHRPAGKTGTKPFRTFTGSGHTETGTLSRYRPLGEITSSNILVLTRET